MLSLKQNNKEIQNIIVSLLLPNKTLITDDTSLIGDAGILDSMKLVELCLALEDLALEMDFEFDWTSDVAMSKSRSMFRTVGSLTLEFNRQKTEQL
jgi:acyl carrier protein